MFIRLRAIYHRALHAYIVWNNETRRKLAALKRYPCAVVAAYKAAYAFLAIPTHENLFQPLTPVLIEPAKIQRYERELLNGLRNDQVRNIAITGEYGAGKSSVLRTFVHRHPEFVYAFVSLATFGKDNESPGRLSLLAIPTWPRILRGPPNPPPRQGRNLNPRQTRLNPISLLGSRRRSSSSSCTPSLQRHFPRPALRESTRPRA